MAPKIRPENSRGFRMLTFWMLVFVANAPNRANATRLALPIAKPFPIAAVVFPAASRMSVFSLAYSISHISAIPPALSEMGPYPSIVKAIDRVDSIPSAARAIPYMSAKVNDTKMVRATKVTGIKVL